MISATATRIKGLLSAGMAYQGAKGATLVIYCDDGVNTL